MGQAIHAVFSLVHEQAFNGCHGECRQMRHIANVSQRLNVMQNGKVKLSGHRAPSLGYYLSFPGYFRTKSA